MVIGLASIIRAIMIGLVVSVVVFILKKVFKLDTLTIYDLICLGILFSLVALLMSSFENKKRKIGRDSILFPQLRIPVLKKYAAKWSILYPGMKKIVLYEAPATYPILGGQTIKYLLLFKFNERFKKGRDGLELFLESSIGMSECLFDAHFSEVYINKDFPYDFRDYWDFTTAIPENANKKHSVVLWWKHQK